MPPFVRVFMKQNHVDTIDLVRKLLKSELSTQFSSCFEHYERFGAFWKALNVLERFFDFVNLFLHVGRRRGRFGSVMLRQFVEQRCE